MGKVIFLALDSNTSESELFESTEALTKQIKLITDDEIHFVVSNKLRENLVIDVKDK